MEGAEQGHMIFAGEAYNVEMGVTNDLFPQATDEAPSCTANKSEPNDIFRNDPTDERNEGFNNPLHLLPDCRCSQYSCASSMRHNQHPSMPPRSAAGSCSAPTYTIQE